MNEKSARRVSTTTGVPPFEHSPNSLLGPLNRSSPSQNDLPLAARDLVPVEKVFACSSSATTTTTTAPASQHVSDPTTAANDTFTPVAPDHDQLNFPPGPATVPAFPPTQKPLVRKWPSTLMRLMNDNNDDEWQPVMERIRTHPDEILIVGQNGGQNALHAACVRYPPLHVVSAILDTRVEAASVQNFTGETPLHLASYSASETVQALLVQKAPETAALPDKYGDRPLHFAARAGATYPLMELFLQAAPDSVSMPNQRGVTPFWLLKRSFLEAECLDDILNARDDASSSSDDDDDDSSEDEDSAQQYADDWNLMVLFLRYAYFRQDAPTSPRADTYCDKPNYDWLVAAAAKTPSCPRQVLRFLCRLFPEQALQYDKDGYTPLLLAAQAAVLPEPEPWDENEDGFREPVQVVEGAIQADEVAPEELQSGGDQEFIHQVAAAAGGSHVSTTTDDDDDDEHAVEHVSVIEVLLEWSPRSAFLPDKSSQRLPLAHALVSGQSWNDIGHLIAACPRALESSDPVTRMHMFQLAALHAPQLDSVYSIVRSLPVLLRLATKGADEHSELHRRKRARIT